jgi:hypothetical protein
MRAPEINRRFKWRPAQAGQTPQTIPVAAALDSWARGPWTDGVQIEQMDEMQSLLVRTRNTWYEITVIDGRSGEVVVSGGQFFPMATRARLAGATFGGSILKLRGIYIGLQMEINTENGPLLTTRVKMIAVESPAARYKLLC